MFLKTFTKIFVIIVFFVKIYQPIFNMKIVKNFFSLIVVCFFWLFSISAKSEESRTLTVFAESNLSVVLTELLRLYSQEYNVITSINFNSPTDIIGDIDMGDPADVVITAHQDSIDNLKHKGLIDVYNIGNIAKDSLNLVTSVKNSQIPSSLLAESLAMDQALGFLNENRAILILDNYASTSGSYSGNYLRSLNLDKFKVFTRLAEDRAPIVNAVLSDENHYAILLSSQINNRKDLKILASIELDIIYKFLVVASDNMNTAREFLKFIETNDKAKQIIAKSGLRLAF